MVFTIDTDKATFYGVKAINRQALVDYIAFMIETQLSQGYRKEHPDGPILSINMPCGNKLAITARTEIPLESVPCPCGDATHWFIKYEDLLEATK